MSDSLRIGGLRGAYPVRPCMSVKRRADAEQQQPEVRFDFGNGSGLAFPIDPDKVYRFGPHGDRLEFTPARKESSRLVGAMRILASAGGAVGTGALALGAAYAEHPVAMTSGAVVLGRLMQQCGLPNVPAKFAAAVARFGSEQMLGVAKEAGMRLARAVGSAATPKNLGAAGVAVAGGAAVRNPEVTRRTVRDVLTTVAATGLTALAALQMRLNRHP